MVKSIEKQLKAAAATTPKVVSHYVYKTEIRLGAVLNRSEFGGPDKFDNNKVYRIRRPVAVYVDHFKKFKEAFKSGGLEAVKAYHDHIINLVKAANPVAQ